MIALLYLGVYLNGKMLGNSIVNICFIPKLQCKVHKLNTFTFMDFFLYSAFYLQVPSRFRNSIKQSAALQYIRDGKNRRGCGNRGQMRCAPDLRHVAVMQAPRR